MLLQFNIYLAIAQTVETFPLTLQKNDTIVKKNRTTTIFTKVKGISLSAPTSLAAQWFFDKGYYFDFVPI
jgi:hypothetical protein